MYVVVAQLELFLRCLNMKQANHLQNVTNAFCLQSPPCFFTKKSVLSLALPNFLTTLIIETWFQASLPAPLPNTNSNPHGIGLE